MIYKSIKKVKSYINSEETCTIHTLKTKKYK